MSGLAKAVKKVFAPVKAVRNILSKATEVVKKVVKSKAFKVIAGAALIYFGGAAIMSMAGGGTASAGIGSAWGGLQGAGSALMSGNVSGAFSALNAGFTGGAAAGATGTFAAGQAATQAAITGQTATIGATSGAYTGKAMETFVANSGGAVQTATPTLTQAVVPAATETAKTGLLANLGEASKAALITSGVNLGGQMIQGYAQQKQAEEQAANRDYFGVNGKGEKSSLAAPGLLNPSNIMPNNPVPQLQPLKSLDDLIARQQQTVNTYQKWGV